MMFIDKIEELRKYGFGVKEFAKGEYEIFSKHLKEFIVISFNTVIYREELIIYEYLIIEYDEKNRVLKFKGYSVSIFDEKDILEEVLTINL